MLVNTKKHPRRKHRVGPDPATSGTCGIHMFQMWAGCGLTLCCCLGSHKLRSSWLISRQSGSFFFFYQGRLLSPVQIDWHSCLLPVSHHTPSATSLDIFTTVNPDVKIKCSNKTYFLLYKSSLSRLKKLE